MPNGTAELSGDFGTSHADLCGPLPRSRFVLVSFPVPVGSENWIRLNLRRFAAVRLGRSIMGNPMMKPLDPVPVPVSNPSSLQSAVLYATGYPRTRLDSRMHYPHGRFDHLSVLMVEVSPRCFLTLREDFLRLCGIHCRVKNAKRGEW